MGNLAYVNGKYRNQNESFISINDRGLQFADSVYDVSTIKNGQFIDEIKHLKRLENSLSMLNIKAPISIKAIQIISRKLLKENKVNSGLIYYQITRGTIARDHVIPQEIKSNIIILTKKIDFKNAQSPIKVITLPDLRHKRVDIKTTMLLPNCIAKTKAKENKAGEAILYNKNKFITEACASNFWIINDENTFITHPANGDILNGITRRTHFQLIKKMGYNYEERAFSIDEAKEAKEAFISSASTFVKPVIQIDECKLSQGVTGVICKKLYDAYIKYAKNQNN